MHETAPAAFKPRHSACFGVPASRIQVNINGVACGSRAAGGATDGDRDNPAPAFIGGEDMRRLSQMILASALVAALLAAGACQRKEQATTPKTTRISATDAYEKYFGPAPTTDKGTCFAFVIYFPSAKETGKVVPFPFFTFDEGSIKRVAVERLIGGMDVGSYKGEFLRPFPPGARLLGISEEKGTVTVNFSRELKNTGAGHICDSGAFDALALTLAQFKGIREVRLEVEGKGGIIHFADGCLIRKPLAFDEKAVLAPGPPRLLDVTALKEKGAKEIEAVHAYFDRPVEIREASFSDADGRQFSGSIYSSVFDMAAVLKPKDPSLFRAGTPVGVRWKVVDKLGRTAEGNGEFRLEIKEH